MNFKNRRRFGCAVGAIAASVMTSASALADFGVLPHAHPHVRELSAGASMIEYIAGICLVSALILGVANVLKNAAPQLSRRSHIATARDGVVKFVSATKRRRIKTFEIQSGEGI